MERHGGHVFKTVGDAIYAVFSAAPAAVAAAAVAGQRELYRHSSGEEEIGALRVRMALHTGTADQREGDYFGPPLNRVAPPAGRRSCWRSRSSSPW